MPAEVVGWDVGGAHLKAVRLDSSGCITQAVQRPCPLWQGLQALTLAFDEMATMLELSDNQSLRHAVTMTGELVDLFPNRGVGVMQIAQHSTAKLGSQVQFYAGDAGFISTHQVPAHVRSIASMNWHASARYVAQQYCAGVLLDIGSTTTDVIPFVNGKVDTPWRTDAERLSHATLHYTGVVRTPVMAVARHVTFKALNYHVVAEHFATMADVYRILGDLNDCADQAPTADGQDKSIASSCRRLARMLGHDLDEASDEDWYSLARALADTQLTLLAQSVMHHPHYRDGIVGIGVGAFLAESLARQLAVPYHDVRHDLSARVGELQTMASVCFPAFAVAQCLLYGI